MMPFEHGTTKVQVVEDELKSQDFILKLFQENLQDAQACMQYFEDQHGPSESSPWEIVSFFISGLIARCQWPFARISNYSQGIAGLFRWSRRLERLPTSWAIPQVHKFTLFSMYPSLKRNWVSKLCPCLVFRLLVLKER
jgi:hypothetical protein